MEINHKIKYVVTKCNLSIGIKLLCIALFVALKILAGCSSDTIPFHRNKINPVDNDIILCLSEEIPFVPRIDDSKNRSYDCIPILVIWRDGSILFGRSENGSNSGNLNNWHYFYGKISVKLVSEKQKHIISAFNFKHRDIDIADYGADAGYLRLYSFFENKRITLNTWENFENAIHDPNHISVPDIYTSDKKIITLSQFYDIWKKIKEDLLSLTPMTVENKTVHIKIDNRMIYMSGNNDKTSMQFELPNP